MAGDLADVQQRPHLVVKPRLAMTCLDQIEQQQLRYFHTGKLQRASIETLVTRLMALLATEDVLLGWGLDRNGITRRYKRQHCNMTA
jgi:hypothetical protein